MYDFLKMYQSVNPSFTSFQDFFFAYSSQIRKIEDDYSFRFGDVTATLLRPIEIDVTKALRTVYLHFSANKYFEVLYKVNYDRYFSSHKHVDLKALRTNVVKGVLSAFKLFYVGCSRAREKLVVIATKQPELITPQYIATLSRLGFEVSVL
jgi:DNA helicase-2/ATP-dependent DNA helicase PcrA